MKDFLPARNLRPEIGKRIKEEGFLMKKIGKVLFPLLLWGSVWQAAAAVVGKELLLPGPGLVLGRLAELAGTAGFWQTAGVSLTRIFGGLLAGVVLGAVLAAGTFAVSVLDWILSPAIKIIRATPVASFILLLWLWVETGKVPGVISCLMVLPVVWGNVTKGLSQADPQLLELAGAYGFGRGKTARLVYVPAALPHFASGCRTAMGLAWKAGVAAEALCLPKQAIGTQVYFSKLYLETADLFAWTFVVIGLSFLLEWGVGLALSRWE